MFAVSVLAREYNNVARIKINVVKVKVLKRYKYQTVHTMLYISNVCLSWLYLFSKPAMPYHDDFVWDKEQRTAHCVQKCLEERTLKWFTLAFCTDYKRDQKRLITVAAVLYTMPCHVCRGQQTIVHSTWHWLLTRSLFSYYVISLSILFFLLIYFFVCAPFP